MKNTRNITKTLLNQQQTTQFKKTRSMTPETSFDDYDLLTVQRSNSKKQRSLTPERRPVTPEMLHKSSKLTASQTSLMSRQSSGSRNSTLERQLKRYEDGRLSRSSSSSSEGENNNNNNRRSNRPPFKTNFGDYKIRRSRYNRAFCLNGISIDLVHLYSDLYSSPNARRIGRSSKRLSCASATRQHLNRQQRQIHRRSAKSPTMPI